MLPGREGGESVKIKAKEWLQMGLEQRMEKLIMLKIYWKLVNKLREEKKPA